MVCRLFFKGEYYSEQEFNDMVANDPVFADKIRTSILADEFLNIFNDPVNANLSVVDIMHRLRAAGLASDDFNSELQKIKSELEDREQRGTPEQPEAPRRVEGKGANRQAAPGPTINSFRGQRAKERIRWILGSINRYFFEGAMKSRAPIVYEAFRDINNLVNVSLLEVEKRNLELMRLKKKYKDILTKDDLASFNHILHGAPISTLALPNVSDPAKADAIRAEFFDVLNGMRFHIDNLTSEIQKTGYLDQTGLDLFEDNKGKYVVRVYEVHFNPTGWWTKLTNDPKMAYVFNNGKRVIRQRLQAHYDDLIALVQQGGHPKKIASYAARADRISRLLNDDARLVDHIRKVMIGEDESAADIVSPGSDKGAADLSLFKKRKTETELPVEIRQMMGEIEDPATLYAVSVERMASFLGKWNFQTYLAAYGEGVLYSIVPDSDSGFTARLPLERLPAVSEMLGLKGSDDNAIYVLPSLKNEIARMAGISLGNGMDNILSASYWLGFFNSIAKSGVTVFSPVGHLKNFLGTIFFGGMNGYLLTSPISYMYETVRGIGGGAFRKIGKLVGADIGESERSEYLFMLGVQTGLLNSEITISEAREFMGPSTPFGRFIEKWSTLAGIQKDKITNKDLSALSNLFNEVAKTPKQLYEGTDNLVKITALRIEIDAHAPLYGYASFKDMFEKTKSSDPAVAAAASDALNEVSKEVAEVLRGTIPNYGESWKLNEFAKRSPFIGMFTTFIMESFRTSINNTTLPLKYVKKAAEETNPKKKLVYLQIAGRRALGVATVAGVTIMAEPFFRATTDAIQSLLGDCGEENLDDCWKRKYAKRSQLAIDVDGRDAFVRYYTPEWVRSVSLRRDPDNPSGFIYEDPYTVNPYGLFSIRAKIRSESRTNAEAFYDYVAPIVSPFFQPEIGAQTLWGVFTGEDKYGNPISTNTFFDNPTGWMRDMGKYIFDSGMNPAGPALKFFGAEAAKLDERIRRNLVLLENTAKYDEKKKLEANIRKDQYALQQIVGMGNTLASFGYKSNYIDIKTQSGFKVNEIADTVDQLKTDYSLKKNKVDDIDKLYEEKNSTYKKKLKFLREMVSETKSNLGVNISDEVKNSLRFRRFDKKAISYILGYLDDAPDIPIKDYETRNK